MLRSVAVWLCWWAFLFVVWLLLVLTQATAEVVAGAVVAAIGATAAEVVRRSRFVELLPRGLLPAPPGATRGPRGVRLLVARRSRSWRQLRRPTGQRRCVSGDRRSTPERTTTRRAATRRALYVALISLTPNTYVIGIDREHNNMLVHELVAGPRETTRERVLGKL